MNFVFHDFLFFSPRVFFLFAASGLEKSVSGRGPMVVDSEGEGQGKGSASAAGKSCLSFFLTLLVHVWACVLMHCIGADKCLAEF